MLQFFRKQSESRIIKFFLGLIMLTFVLWGFGSFLTRGAAGRNVAVVGKAKITEKEWYKALNQQVGFRERVFGRKMLNEEVNDPAFRSSVINMMVNGELINQEAKKMKLLIGDDTAALNIMENSFFRDEDGTIDREKLERYLKYQGISEQQFFEIVKEDLKSKFVLDAIKNANFTLDSTVRLLASAYYAKHKFNVYELSAEDITIEHEPSAEELQSIYRKDGVAYTVPEKRKVLYIMFSERDIDVEKEVDELEAKNYYDDNAELFITPQKRSLYHIVFKNVEEASSATSNITTLESFEELAQASGIEIDSDEFEIGLKARDELLPEIASYIFNSPKGLVNKPLKTSLGWHLFFVAEIIPASEKAFEEVEDEIKAKIIEMRQDMELTQVVQRIDGDLISGFSLQDIAENYSMKVKSSNFVYDGGVTNDTAGNAVLSAIKEKATDLAVDEVLGVEYEESTQNYYVVRLQEVFPQHLQEFAHVKDSVLKTWQAENKEAEAKRIFGELSALIVKANELEENTNSVNLSAEEVVSTEVSDNTEEEGVVANSAIATEELNSVLEEIAQFVASNSITVNEGVILEAREKSEYEAPVVAGLMALMENCESEVLQDKSSGKYLKAFCKGIDTSLEGVEAEELEKVLGNISQMITNNNKQLAVDELFEYLRTRYSIKTNDPVIFKEISIN